MPQIQRMKMAGASTMFRAEASVGNQTPASVWVGMKLKRVVSMVVSWFNH